MNVQAVIRGLHPEWQDVGPVLGHDPRRCDACRIARGLSMSNRHCVVLHSAYCTELGGDTPCDFEPTNRMSELEDAAKRFWETTDDWPLGVAPGEQAAAWDALCDILNEVAQEEKE